MQYLDIGDKLNLELKGDNLRANDTLWDETILNRPKELDAQLLEEFEKHTVCKVYGCGLSSFRITFQKGVAKSHNHLKRLVQHYLQPKTRKGHVA